MTAGDVLFGLGSVWKFELKATNDHPSIVYTGEVLEEDDISIKISTIRDEIRIVLKEEIRQAFLQGDVNG